MRRLVVTENITLDGVVSPIGDWFDPSTTDDELAAVNQRNGAGSDALVLGRTTYEEFAGFWPHQQGEVSAYLDQVAKYVVSSSLDKADWQNTTILRGPLEDEIAALKATDGQDITVTGSATLVRSLIPTGLVDLFRLFVYPVVQGHGTRLFEEHSLRLEPVRAQTFASGVVLLEYAYSG
ncbi:dihydrofolate reductase [Paractinoplanes abujensis]|uniref:Dihydrofolate reductase n=1 Tax=Paractinoplanes abujensis TaxID=882441 RepID=A0A7W7D089_9ACTN|nr:dihydrofolate reductase family protein [Actinoplanes abujensis]MBB4697887.1 dihydrofolate reductase [Actinoplanes abujensis]GID19629.1 dihydrofolate reductase [Actinoplanes abujensis]